MPTFRLSLPPTSNHQYQTAMVRGRGNRLMARTYKTDRYQAWLDEAATITRGWQPPKQTPLIVSILLAIPTKTGRNADLDGYIKPLLDATVGKLYDQWVDHLEVDREVGTGYAIITIKPKQEEESCQRP